MFAIRKNGIVWIAGDTNYQTQDIHDAEPKSSRKEMESKAIELAYNDKGNLYEVYNLQNCTKTLSIRFGRET